MLTLGARAGSTSSDKPVFHLDFQAGHPLVFAVETKQKNVSEQTMETQTGNQTALTRTSTELRYKFRLTPVKQLKSGGWTVHYQPFDYEQDVDLFGKGTHVITTLRGSEVKTAQNGITVVDTAKNIGVGQAKAFKQGVYPRMISGEFDFAPDGTITRISGDVPFVDFWTETTKLQVGFFDIAFSTEPIPSGGSWEKTVQLKYLQGLQLGDDGITQTNHFTRENDNQTSSNRLAVFGLTMAINRKNITGTIEQMGQISSINLPEFNSDKTATFQYDPARGCFVSGTEEESAKVSMEMLVQGRTSSLTMDISDSTQFTLLPGTP